MSQKRNPTQQSGCILVIDDDPGICELYNSLLSNPHKVLHCSNISTALETRKNERPDLIILDFKLGKENAFDFLHALSEEELSQQTIILVSGEIDIQNRIRAFQSGAIDIITKPVDINELKLRAEAHLKQRISLKNSPHTVLQFENLVLNPFSCEVSSKNGETIELTQKEAHLLSLLLTHSPSPIPRLELKNSVWKNAHVSDQSLDTHLSHLRKKLLELNWEIELLPNEGYHLKPKNP